MGVCGSGGGGKEWGVTGGSKLYPGWNSVMVGGAAFTLEEVGKELRSVK